jgi:alpha-beta hydrolase superfamily lysophospholipase
MGTLPVILQNGTTETLAINVFQPPGDSQGTLMLLHGYMAHAGDFAFTLGWFASRGWTVVTLDLPGHGLSEGKRADIDSFADYGDAVTVWMNWIFEQGWPGPTVLLAHSLGSAAGLEALRRPGATRPDLVIFCAPLLRTNWYPALSLADWTIGGWIAFMAQTFGQGDWEPRVHWFQALGRWLSDLDQQGPIDLPLWIYSGDHDSVVDADWNRWKYHKLVPGVRWTILPGKDHWFLSSKADREAFHEQLTADLAQKFPTLLPPQASQTSIEPLKDQ